VEWKYGPRGYRFVHVDAGLACQTLYLVAAALQLRTCAVAAFSDALVNDLLRIDGRREFATLLMPVGTPHATSPDGQTGRGGQA
jgi:SagB-type dehydrogenase family enzyme